MQPTIEFYFDFSSPYGYLASTQIEAVARRHGRQVDWRPFLVGAAMQRTGHQPLVDTPLIGAYARHDMQRCARLLGVPFTLPEPFPVAAVAASRAFYWLRQADPALAVRFAQGALHAYFVAGINISQTPDLAAIATAAGADGDALEQAVADPAIKDLLRQENERALERGVFGSPFVLVDGEAFWGADRLPQVDRWLATGGW